MEYLQFIFQSFWHFIGILLLCSVVFGGLGQIFSKKTHIHYHEKDENENEKAK